MVFLAKLLWSRESLASGDRLEFPLFSRRSRAGDSLSLSRGPKRADFLHRLVAFRGFRLEGLDGFGVSGDRRALTRDCEVGGESYSRRRPLLPSYSPSYSAKTVPDSARSRVSISGRKVSSSFCNSWRGGVSGRSPPSSRIRPAFRKIWAPGISLCSERATCGRRIPSLAIAWLTCLSMWPSLASLRVVRSRYGKATFRFPSLPISRSYLK